MRSIAHLALVMLAASANIAECSAAQKTAPVTAASGETSDGREVIELDPSERARLLEGMRLYLQSIEGIVEALAANKPAVVASYAHQAGTKMLQDAPLSISFKAPLEFITLSVNTHQKFDTLAAQATNSSRSEILTAVADILTGCTGCHAVYRIAR